MALQTYVTSAMLSHRYCLTLVSPFDSRKQFNSHQQAYHARFEALSLVKKENDKGRHYALKLLVKLLLSKNGTTELHRPLTSIVMKYPLVVPKFIEKWLINAKLNISQVLVNPLHSLVNMFSLNITSEKIKTQELSLDFNNLSAALQNALQMLGTLWPSSDTFCGPKKTKPQL